MKRNKDDNNDHDDVRGHRTTFIYHLLSCGPTVGLIGVSSDHIQLISNTNIHNSFLVHTSVQGF